MELKWIKLANKFYNDGRIKFLRSQNGGNDYVLIWTMLLSLAGDCNLCGAVCISEGLPYTAQSLARELDYKVSVVKKALVALEQVKLIDIENGIIYISDWDTVQSADKLAEIKEKHREAQKRYREKRKNVVNNNLSVMSPVMSPVTSQSYHSDAVEEDKEKEKEKDFFKKEMEKEIKISDRESQEEDICDSVVSHFNTATTAFPKIKILSVKQKEAVIKAVSEVGFESIKACFEAAQQSDFLKGENRQGWVAGFDWLINPENIAKVLNGNYGTVYGQSSGCSGAFDGGADNNSSGGLSGNTDKAVTLGQRPFGLLSSVQGDPFGEVNCTFDEDEFIEAALKRGFSDF